MIFFLFFVWFKVYFSLKKSKSKFGKQKYTRKTRREQKNKEIDTLKRKEIKHDTQMIIAILLKQKRNVINFCRLIFLSSLWKNESQIQQSLAIASINRPESIRSRLVEEVATFKQQIMKNCYIKRGIVLDTPSAVRHVLSGGRKEVERRVMERAEELLVSR